MLVGQTDPGFKIPNEIVTEQVEVEDSNRCHP